MTEAVSRSQDGAPGGLVYAFHLIRNRSQRRPLSEKRREISNSLPRRRRIPAQILPEQFAGSYERISRDGEMVKPERIDQAEPVIHLVIDACIGDGVWLRSF